MNGAGARVLIYSHDTFGLGHLRRCRAIAQALAAAHERVSVLILSGSPIIGSFEFPARVDFVRVPGVIKLQNGAYEALRLKMGIDETIRLRADIIDGAADAFHPDIVIVDKEPLGLRGELEHALPRLKDRGSRLVLGLRDVLDDVEALAAEWQRKRALPALESLYDDIWVYGSRAVYDPLDGLDLSPAIGAKITYTGYLRRGLPLSPYAPRPFTLPADPFVLVTTGGGGDGDGLVEWTLAAYETRAPGLMPAVLVLGPFMEPSKQEAFLARAQHLPLVTALTFDAEIERLEARAAGIVAMGGYNTFCEILSLDKPAVIVPREKPRKEQWLRARRAADLGLVRMLEDPAEQGRDRDPMAMVEALRALPHQDPPSRHMPKGLLDGLDVIAAYVGRVLR